MTCCQNDEKECAAILESHARLLAAAKVALYYIEDAAIYHIFKAAIAAAEEP